MRDLLPVFLPVIWLLVATIVALILYRTSETLFEERAAKSTQGRRVRLTGSVVIAALAFYGLKTSTSTAALDVRTGYLPVNEVRANLLAQKLATAASQLHIANECAGHPAVVRDCRREIGIAHMELLQVQKQYLELTGLQ
ncbi:hypothetical protein [Rhizobium halophilum]|uniref:hypothetical protein n=1 Tax=Rhizobium halophilum TaxID=2846852 RepID=UPI001EFDC51D|nr:hypothetical protein [Rhizobium halophilum]MCF6368345.1 hypothetical protein [Rhizobium halophilum]